MHEPRATGQVVLILDDDSAVRNSLKFVLEVEGFEVRTYASPNELLHDDGLPDFICLIVDYHMPEMNGLDVVITLRERRPPMHAILITGHPNVRIRERAFASGVPIVEKPFRGTALTDCIYKLLDECSKSLS